MELGQARTIPDVLAIRARREPSGFYFELYDELHALR